MKSNMKTHLVRSMTLAVALITCATARAQYDVMIGDSETLFTFFVDSSKMTAEMRDDNHRIDDRKHPLYKGHRSMKGFKRIRGTHTLVVPEKVQLNGNEYTITSIGRAAFAGYDNLDYVVLPTSVTTIGDYAFFRSSIKAIELPPSVAEVGQRAFGYCEQLKSITTAMGGVRIAQEDFAESKDCQLVFKSREDYARTQQARPSATRRQPVATVGNQETKQVKSDVDDNLPVATISNDNMFVVIVANEDYQKVAHVPYAIHDGETFKQYCQTVLGVPDVNISFLTNATLLNMQSELDQMKNIAEAYEGQASFIFYYAGHGFPSETAVESYLLPVDGTGMNTKEGLSLTDLYHRFGQLNTRGVTVFLDACFSGSQRGDGMLTSARGVAIKVKQKVPDGNVVVFSAAQSDQTANPYHDQGHGLFTYFLLKKLKEKPTVTLGELGDYISAEVGKISTVRIRKMQKPLVHASPACGTEWRRYQLR